MCLIKQTEITYSDGRKDTKNDEPILCTPASNGQPCPRTEYSVTKERRTYSKPLSPSSRTTPSLIHQRHQPRERYYDGSIGISFKGLKPSFSIKRAKPPQSLERYEGPSRHQAQSVPPLAPAPPPIHDQSLRLRTTPRPQVHAAPAITGPTPTTAPISRTKTYITKDTLPSNHTPGVQSSSKPKAKGSKPRPAPLKTTYVYTAADIQALNTNTTPISSSSYDSTTASHRSYIPGISHLRSEASRRDSAYASGIASPVSSPRHGRHSSLASRAGSKKPESRSDAGRGKEVKRYNDTFNYMNDVYSGGEERGRPPTLRGVPRVGERLRGDAEETRVKMERVEGQARGYQAAGLGDDSSVVVESNGKDRSGQAVRRTGHGSHRGHRRHESEGSKAGEGSRR